MNSHDRVRLVNAMGGERATVRAEQLRARGLSDRAIAEQLDLPIEAVWLWFDLQDELVLPEEAGGAA
jgi:hypothetical protein